MGYTQPAITAPPIRSIDDGDYEVPGNGRSWWTARLEPAISTGLRDLEWHRSGDGDSTYWGVRGTYGGGSVTARIPRLLEHRDGTPVSDEIMVVTECHITPLRLGSWVIESPPKWFRRRRGWALNRPKFSTGDSWFDMEAGCWAWDCADGPDALRDALVPALPAIRQILDAHPGAIVTETSISAWIPDVEVRERLPRLLSAVRGPSREPASS